MTRLSTVAALALASALLTPFVVQASGGIRSGERAAVSAPARIEAPAPAKAEAAPVAAPCAKRIKVVYGEGTGCAPTPENRI